MIDSRRRVLFLIPTLTGGGAERVIVTLLRHLDRSKFQLALAVVDMRHAVFRDDVPEDVEFIDLKCSRVRYALPKIMALIWHRRPSVVFSTLGHLNLALAIFRSFLPNSIHYLARETTVVSEGLKSYTHPDWWAWSYRRFYGRFDRVICQSKYMRDDLIAHFGLPADRFVVLNNPVDVEAIHRLACEPLVTGLPSVDTSETNRNVINLVSAGRLVAVKGLDLLIEALALCGNPNLRLTLLGDGPLRNELEALAKKMGVHGQINFVGFQQNPYPYFSQADAFVLSSRFEGFPNVVLEALTCGVPVISTPAPGGVHEILDGVAGCVMARCLTAASLANAIASFIPGRRIPLSVVEPYFVEKIVKGYASELMSDAVA